MIILIWIFNFIISCFNAWSCGRSWNETKHVGGFAHLLNWCGAIMSASGFTWCYLVIAVTVGGTWPVELEDGTMGTYLSAETVQVVADLGFILVYFPIIGSGIVITLQAWASFWKRKTLSNAAISGYDTFAMAYNIRQGFVHLPGMFNNVENFFDSDSDDKNIVLIIVAAVALAGILTTYFIIKNTASGVRRQAAFELESRR